MDIDSITNLGNFGLSIVLVFMLLKFVMTTVKDMLINLTKINFSVAYQKVEKIWKLYAFHSCIN